MRPVQIRTAPRRSASAASARRQLRRGLELGSQQRAVEVGGDQVRAKEFPLHGLMAASSCPSRSSTAAVTTSATPCIRGTTWVYSLPQEKHRPQHPRGGLSRRPGESQVFFLRRSDPVAAHVRRVTTTSSPSRRRPPMRARSAARSPPARACTPSTSRAGSSASTRTHQPSPRCVSSSVARLHAGEVFLETPAQGALRGGDVEPRATRRQSPNSTCPPPRAPRAHLPHGEDDQRHGHDRRGGRGDGGRPRGLCRELRPPRRRTATRRWPRRPARPRAPDPRPRTPAPRAPTITATDACRPRVTAGTS